MSSAPLKTFITLAHVGVALAVVADLVAYFGAPFYIQWLDARELTALHVRALTSAIVLCASVCVALFIYAVILLQKPSTGERRKFIMTLFSAFLLFGGALFVTETYVSSVQQCHMLHGRVTQVLAGGGSGAAMVIRCLDEEDNNMLNVWNR